MAALQLLPGPWGGAPVKSIVYGIVDANRAEETELPPGLRGAELDQVRHGDLAALLSPLPDGAGEAAGIEQALAYARIVERLHHELTIVPMRYGCFVTRKEQVEEFLRRNEDEFLKALASIEGCDEVGVRLLLPRTETREEGTAGAAAEAGADSAPGAGYLSARRRYYDQQAEAEAICRGWAERVQAVFGGMFRQSSWEYIVRPEGMLLSLSFLVEKPRVAAFQRAFHEFRRAHAVGAICSGPWPPYVLVAGLAQPDVAAQAELQFLQRKKG